MSALPLSLNIHEQEMTFNKVFQTKLKPKLDTRLVIRQSLISKKKSIDNLQKRAANRTNCHNFSK